MIEAANFRDLEWLDHGFGLRDSALPEGIRTVKQIHSSIVLDAVSTEKDDTVPAGRQGDALISDRAGVRVGVKTADCVPILLVDPSIPAVAAIHAGWRGTAENIGAAVIRELAARWKTRPADLRAAIGPSIGVCCYEVGPDVARRFGTWIPKMANAQDPVHLDLPAVNEMQLRDAGVSDIWKSGECTFCTANRFFSFRREREQAGRMLSFIGLKKHIGRTSEDPPGKPSEV
jgi:polyphenol oxidase